ncbi:MAG: hypothetical protein IH933_13920 [Euryarchaeota archaeon]|jgi:hypothetical protein|nr:hypothetical protein [Euryarchaeota archaeon]
MRRRDLLASMLAGCALSGCIGDHEPLPGEPGEPDNSEEPEEPEEPEEGERVEIVESVLIRENVGTDEETVAVGGVVIPREGVEVSYVEIRASFYDMEGELLDTTIEQVEIDEETNRWEFEVTYPQMGEQAAEVDEYELEVGTEL